MSFVVNKDMLVLSRFDFFLILKKQDTRREYRYIQENGNILEATIELFKDVTGKKNRKRWRVTPPRDIGVMERCAGTARTTLVRRS